MSATFVPNRMEEIFTSLYEDNVMTFTQYVQTELTKIQQFVDQTEPTVNHLKATGKRSSTQAIDLRSHLQEECEILAKQCNEIKELSNCRVKSLAKQINAANTEITKLQTSISQIHVSVEAVELQIQSGRQFINEIHKTQISDLQNLRRDLPTKSWRTHFRASARSMRSDFKRIKHENEIQTEPLSEIRRMLGEKQSNEGGDDRLTVLRAVNNAKECTELQRISDELELPQASVLSSELIANAVHNGEDSH
jgi:hypothetical protein